MHYKTHLTTTSILAAELEDIPNYTKNAAHSIMLAQPTP